MSNDLKALDAKYRKAIRSLIVTAEVNDGRDGTYWAHALEWFDALATAPSAGGETGVKALEWLDTEDADGVQFQQAIPVAYDIFDHAGDIEQKGVQLAREDGGIPTIIAFFPSIEAAQQAAQTDYATISALSPSTAEGAVEPHPDDIAVDRFSVAMKAKLAKKRVDGRSGWEDKDGCTAAFLSSLLHGHVIKGDPVDVGNLAMMLHQRGETILQTPNSAEMIEGVSVFSSRVTSPPIPTVSEAMVEDLRKQVYAEHLKFADLRDRESGMPRLQAQAALEATAQILRMFPRTVEAPNGVTAALPLKGRETI